MEATAIGNIMIQAKAAGLYDGISDMRKSIQQSVELNWFEPQNSEEWEVQYGRFEQLTMDN
jgi:rhamnulokinase